ncbi:MAG: cytochrome c3 family protein [Pseudomonadota bacterium]
MKQTALFLLILTVVLTGISNSADNKGPKEIALEGGTGGTVPFPHHRHQDALGNCMICHEMFPQKSGAIQEFKSLQKLTPKEVMNKSCIKCHREKKSAGEKSGPITCTTCHQK